MNPGSLDVDKCISILSQGVERRRESCPVACYGVRRRNLTEYVEFLSDENYIPPNAKQWVDYIRKKGNEATHEISIMNAEDAKDLIDFIEMLLKLIYEFPATIKRKTNKT